MKEIHTPRSLLLATSLFCLVLLLVIICFSLLFLSLLPAFCGQGAFTCNSRKPLTTCCGKWSRMANGGSSSWQTGEQRTCVMPGKGTCATTSGGPGSPLVSTSHFPACPHASPKSVYYCSCTACGKVTSTRKMSFVP